MQYKAHQNYRQTVAMPGNPREAEGRALMSAARQIAQAAGRTGNRQQLNDALMRNAQLWNIFALEVAQTSNPLPDDTKQHIVNLWKYITDLTQAVILAPNKKKIEQLISLNRIVASGLLTTTADSAAAAQSGASSPHVPATVAG
jgi:flagellar biosynthesis activator protein FlaF